MGRLTYLVVLAGCLMAVAWLEPVLRIGVLRQWRRLLLTVLSVAVLFVAWDLAAVAAGHWSYATTRVAGWSLPGGLPIEEVLFFLVVPVCAIFGFEAVRTVLRRYTGSSPTRHGGSLSAPRPADLLSGPPPADLNSNPRPADPVVMAPQDSA